LIPSQEIEDRLGNKFTADILGSDFDCILGAAVV